MKVKKFMVEFTKAVIDNKKGVVVWKKDESVFMSYNGFFGVIVPETLYIYNLAIRDRDYFLELPAGAERVKILHYEKDADEKKELAVFSNNEALDAKHLSFFEKNAEFMYFKDAFYVMENGVLVGVIMPVKKGSGKK